MHHGGYRIDYVHKFVKHCNYSIYKQIKKTTTKPIFHPLLLMT